MILAYWAIKMIGIISPNDLPRLNTIGLDHRVIAIMGFLVTASGIIFGMIPAFQAIRMNFNEIIKSGTHGITTHISKHQLHQSIVITEVALATVLVINAGLLIKSFGHLMGENHGFQIKNILVIPLTLRGQPAEHFENFYEAALNQVKDLPGVESAALCLQTPLESRGFRFTFQADESASRRSLSAVVRI